MKARSRRWFLGLFPAASVMAWADESQGKGRVFASAIFRYPDPSTEFPIVRLTDPAHTSILPAGYNRPVSKHNFLLYSSDIGGRFEVFRLDLKNGQSKQLTDAQNLRPDSVAMLAEDRGFLFADGDRVQHSGLSNLRARDVCKIPAGFECGGLSIADDGVYSAVVEKKPGLSRLQLIHMTNGTATKLAECEDEIRDPIPRPRRASVLYRRGSAVWLANYDGSHDSRLKLAEGETGPARWSPDGRTILYLNYPADKTQLHNLREFTPDTGEDKMLSKTTQFVGFGINADATVFVGASGSKASPHVLLLVREVQRELTLAEHKASDARMVAPVFSPNSQRVFFVSDRDGKPAIYTLAVDRLVESTEG